MSHRPILTLPRFGWFEHVFLSPAQHRIDHGRDHAEGSSNVGVWLGLWDRLAGTWVTAAPSRRARSGSTARTIAQTQCCR
jgi:sterol desaturase/sphingolipid hydroxylase (fatty acid hydroxylase superfamily)